MYDYNAVWSMLHKILEPDRIEDKCNVLLKFSCNAFYQHKWYSYLTKLDILQI